MVLYLRKAIKDIVYYEVANELAQFVFKKLFNDSDTISDKLSLSLEELRRRGVPVGLVIKSDQQPLSKLY